MTSSNQPTEFQKFEALTRRILTTPKSDLIKSNGKQKHPPKPTTKKRK